MLQPAADPQGNPNPATLVVTLPIHNKGNDDYRCGTMSVTSMIQALAVLYTLQNDNLISSNNRFDLRALVLDNCANSLRIDQDLMSLASRGTLCNEEFNSMGSIIDRSTIMGVQTTSSRYVVAANRVTSPLKMQLLSSSASSTALSDQWRYPYFARTVPPDDVQMGVIGNILRDNGWTYVGVVYSQESYGINGYRTLRNIVNSGGFSCVGVAQGVSYKSTVEEARTAIRNIAAEDGIGVIVVIATNVRTILDAIIAEGVASRFVVIGSDSWADSLTIIDGIAHHFAGAITVDFRDSFYLPFINFVKGIKYDNRMGIPDDWFEEFYQHIQKCHLTNAGISLTQYDTACRTNLEITTEQVKKYGVGIRAIMATVALGKGLGAFSLEYRCGGQSFASCMGSVTDARDVLFNMTLKQTRQLVGANLDPTDNFNLELGYDDRYWNIGYTISVVRKAGLYEKIGSEKEGVFFFNKTKYNGFRLSDSLPSLADIVSACPEDTYCDCVLSDVPEPSEQVQPKYMRDHEPRNYFMYDAQTGEQVYTWPTWAIAVAVLTCIGLLVALTLFCYFLVFYPVKGGTTVLGFLMMLGVFGIYAINFAFFLPASAATCGARQFVMGVVYAIAIAPLFVKAVDNWRFKDTEYSPERYIGLTNPLALVLITLGLILIQCIIPAEWLILRNPSASLMSDSTSQHDWMWCDPHDFYDISLVLSFSFVMFLVLMTAIFSALSWDSDSNYYESRWIFVACVCTGGCFLVWMVVSTNAGAPYRDPAVAIANFVNATCLLLLIPFRKLILLCQFQAEEENAKSMPDYDNNEMYSTVYSNQMFQPVFQTEDKPVSEHEY